MSDATAALCCCQMSEPGATDELPHARETEDEARPPYRISWTLTRAEWLASEWPAIPFHGGLAVAFGFPMAAAVYYSLWCLLLVPVWFPVWFLLGGGRQIISIVVFLIRGDVGNELTIEGDGVMLHAYPGEEPRGAPWRGFQSYKRTFVLCGGDGRHRLVIPRRALTEDDMRAIAARVGVDLAQMPERGGRDLPDGVRAPW